MADTERLIQLNIADLTRKTQTLMQVWQARSLTPLRRIVIANMLVASTYVYKLLCLFTPHHTTLESIKKDRVDFIWNTKQHKIRYEILIKEINEGGLNLVDLE